MKCVIPGINLKVLARAIHALAKIGDDMYIQPQKDALSLRTVNMANSAFADFKFNENFFTYYNYGDISAEDALKCKISVRSAMTVFKTPNTLEKQIETCHIKLTPDASKIIFILKYKNSIVKTHLLPIIDCDVLKASYNKDSVLNKLSLQPRVLSDVVQNFSPNLLEITMDVNQEKTFIRNYIDESSNLTNETRTQLVLGSGEFENYTIGSSHSVITFCLKELRALLNFAEGSNLVVHIHFETAGRPVVIFLKNPLYEVDLVQSTLNPDTDTQSENSVAPGREKLAKKNRTTMNNSKKRQLKRNTNKTIAPKRAKKSATVDKTINDTVFRLMRSEHPPETPKCNKATRTSLVSAEINSCQSTPSIDQHLDQSQTDTNTAMEVDEQEDDEVPSSPKRKTSKKARMIFQKCFQTTFHPAMLPGHDTVLAEDTDEEND